MIFPVVLGLFPESGSAAQAVGKAKPLLGTALAKRNRKTSASSKPIPAACKHRDLQQLGSNRAKGQVSPAWAGFASCRSLGWHS